MLARTLVIALEQHSYPLLVPVHRNKSRQRWSWCTGLPKKCFEFSCRRRYNASIVFVDFLTMAFHLLGALCTKSETVDQASQASYSSLSGHAAT